MQTLRDDLTFALRQLRRSPGFTAAVALILAVGIGANTAIFSAVEAVLLRPPPYPEPDRLRVLRPTLTDRAGTADTLWWSYPMYEAFRERASGFEALAAYTPRAGAYNLAGPERPERARVEFVSAGYLPLLGVGAAVGRAFLPEEDREPGARPVALLSHGLWSRLYGADSTVVGRTIELDAVPLEVVGVLPRGFRGLSGQADVWVPMMMAPALTFPRRLEGELSFWHFVIGRLPSEGAALPGGDRAAGGAAADRGAASGDEGGGAGKEGRAHGKEGEVSGEGDRRIPTRLAAIARAVERRIPLSDAFGDRRLGFVSIPLSTARVEPGARAALGALMGAAGFLLLIICVNVANLLLTRSTRRRRELGVRLALGAGPARLGRQLALESLALALLGGIGAVVVAGWGIRLLRALQPPGFTGAADLAGIGLGRTALLFDLALAAAVGLAVGLLPALRAGRADVRQTLEEGGRAVMGSARSRGWLVAVQVGLALVLLTGAGLMLRSLGELRAVPLGFRPGGVLTAHVNLPSRAYPDAELVRFLREVDARAAALPGVADASVANCLPLTGDCDRVSIEIEGRPLAPGEPARPVWTNMVDGGYFRTLGIPLLAGRTFGAADRADAPRVVIVDEAAARAYWPDGDPLGARVRLSFGWEDWAEVVGVVGSVPGSDLRDAGQPGVYMPYAQMAYGSNYLVLRPGAASGGRGSLAGPAGRAAGGGAAPAGSGGRATASGSDPLALVDPLRAVVRDLDPALPVWDVQTMEERVAAATAPARFSAVLLSVAAALALLVAALGVFAVTAVGVAARTREFGLRMALGAGPGDVLRQVLRREAVFALAGLAGGAVAAAGLTRFLSGQLFGVSATDPAAFGAAALLLLATALAAAWLPARAAARVDPLVALRRE